MLVALSVEDCWEPPGFGGRGSVSKRIGFKDFLKFVTRDIKMALEPWQNSMEVGFELSKPQG